MLDAVISYLNRLSIDFLLPDTTAAHVYLHESQFRKGSAPIIIIPDSEDKLISSVKVLVQNKMPITVRGSGTSTAGAALPDNSALIVTTKLYHVKIYPDDLIAEVEPGALLSDIKHEAEKYGLHYPPDPASQAYATIGGTIATNAGGPSTVRLGVTRDYIRKIRFVDGRGNIVDSGKAVHKYSTAYFLPPLFCGSEGTLGVLTRAWIKLIPAITHAYYYEIEEPDLSLFHQYRLHGFSQLEFIDPLGGKIVKQKEKSYLLLKLDGATSEELSFKKTNVEPFLDSIGAVWRGGKSKEDIWSVRSSLSPLSYTLGSVKISQDIVVPLSKIPDFVLWLSTKAPSYKNRGVFVYSFGHIGDGNLHVNIMTEPQLRNIGEALQKEIFNKVSELGGTISGEHGIGTARKKYLNQFISKEELLILKEIKRAFDPENLMNPGKIF